MIHLPEKRQERQVDERPEDLFFQRVMAAMRPRPLPEKKPAPVDESATPAPKPPPQQGA
jgi:hypothetical protein